MFLPHLVIIYGLCSCSKEPCTAGLDAAQTRSVKAVGCNAGVREHRGRMYPEEYKKQGDDGMIQFIKCLTAVELVFL